MDIPILTSQLHRPETSVGDSYLRFQINADTPALLAMKYVQEVLIVPTTRITPMPNMPECILGLFNRRNRILWAVDLALMLLAQPIDASSQQYHSAIVRVGETPLSLIVREIQGVTRVTSNVQPAAGESTALLPYLEGYVWQQQEKLLVLDAKAIVNSPSLHSY
ncbi:chemotaxis protein CheW [Chroococcidiopsis sp. TS-821]|uniref:chemotaxis protein CheW n=1 Tax=Chroococcidiopsis sp. TS-821 TaxID=1378066 RepID=UPI000CEDBB5C|nr:chemotaxis protein CheW [Chroococcidiopsis sp. TS-821]PPS39113.1 chemotaxis protein CheW [Chroococcidiopsis sp. TS-821]